MLSLVFMCVCFQMETDNPVNDANPHISNIGRMVEVRIQSYILY